MALTNEQLVALKLAAQADQFAAEYIANGQDDLLRDWLNYIESTFYVWRNVFTPEQARTAIANQIAQLDNLTVGKRDSLFWFFSEPVIPSDPAANVVAAIDNFCGSQNLLKGSLQDAIRRPSTRAEKILAAGAGTSESPATMAWEGLFTTASASQVRGV